MKIHTRNANSLMTTLALFFVFLGSLDFVNRYFYWFFIAFFMFFVGNNKNVIKINNSAILLLAFAVFVVIFSPDTLLKYTYVIKPFVYPFCYLFGYNILARFENKPDALEKNVKKLLFIIVGALMLHWCLNMYINQGVSYRLDLVDYWTKTTSSATLMASVAAIPIGFSCALLIASPEKLEKIFSIAVLILCLLFNLTLGGRTIILMVLICLSASILFVILNSKSSKQKRNIILGIIFSVIVIFVIYTKNLFSIREIFENSTFYDRFFGEFSIELDHDGRSTNKQDHLKNMIYYPFGGDKLRESLGWRSAHDLYLDTYSYSGIFSFIVLLCFIFASISNTIKIVKSKKISLLIKTITVCTYIVFHLEFFIEPIIRGIPWFLAIFCFVDGVMAAFLSYKDK